MRTVFLLLIALSASAGEVERLRVDGPRLVARDGSEVVLRGVNWGWWGTAEPGDGPALRAMGGNCVRMPIRWYFEGEKSDIRRGEAPGHIDPAGLAQLDRYLRWAADAGLWIVLFAGSDRGAGSDERHYWNTPALRREFIEMWAFLANRYAEHPRIAAYEILSEPHPKKPTTDADLRAFYRDVINAVRAADPLTPVMVGPNDHYAIEQLDAAFQPDLAQVIYTANYYLPKQYAKVHKQWEGNAGRVAYPGSYVDRDGERIAFDAAHLATLLAPALRFRSERQVPIFINQVGVRSAAPGHHEYLADVLSLFDRHGVGFAYWTWRTRHGPLEHGLHFLDASTGTYRAKSDQLAILGACFQRVPASAAATSGAVR